MTNATLQIEARDTDGNEHALDLALTESGCWNGYLGGFPLPASAARDTRDAAFGGARLAAATLTGCASASLLPLIWLRDIWAEPGATVTLDWNYVDDPGDTPKRQAAGLLACALADEVRCADTAAAARLWGYDETRRTETADRFDLLAELMQAQAEGTPARTAAGWEEAVREAFYRCAARGERRVALYGAGTHTRAIGEALCTPEVEIVCIIDDDARRHGTTLWGFPIIAPDRILEQKVDAVVLSANSIEQQLWDRPAPLREAGISVERLYTAG